MTRSLGPLAPQARAQRIAEILRQAQEQCLADDGRSIDAKAEALFETVAEVLDGVVNALNDFACRQEVT